MKKFTIVAILLVWVAAAAFATLRDSKSKKEITTQKKHSEKKHNCTHICPYSL